MKKCFGYILFLVALLAMSPSANLSAYVPENLTTSFNSTSDWPQLHQAILQKEFDKALWIMKLFPQQVKDRSQPNHYGFSALELAILLEAPIEFIETLIAYGADVKVQRQVDLKWAYNEIYYEIRTPLAAACIMKNTEVIELLISNGANPGEVLQEVRKWTEITSGDYTYWFKRSDMRWLSIEEMQPSYSYL